MIRQAVKPLMLSLLVIGGLVLVYAAWSALDRPIQTIVVSGEPTEAERRRVEESMASAELAGILSTDLVAIEAQLRKMDWTRDVTVRRHWPDRLEIRLHKVVPVAKWGDHDYLAANGEPLQLPDRYAHLPALNAHISTPQQTMEVYRLLQLFASRQELRITRLTESPQGEWQVGFSGGMHLRLGARDVNERMERFLRAYAVALKEQPRRIDYVDARYTSGIAVRFKLQQENEEPLAGQMGLAVGVLGVHPKTNGS